MHVISEMKVEAVCRYVVDKTALLSALKDCPRSLVVLDYTLFDIQDASGLLIFCERFPDAHFVIFSEELSLDFVRYVVVSSRHISVLLKESPMSEIRNCLSEALNRRQFVCSQIQEMLSRGEEPVENAIDKLLTKTEREVLRDIALGMTTKEIADHRYSSFHTVNTHRKNIFRKIGVNNVHEATRYALRAGLVDAAEYLI